MAYRDRVSEIAYAVQALPHAGIVHNRSRIATDWGRYIELFVDPATRRINGWEISRRAPSGTQDGSHWDELYVLRKFYGVRDSDESDLAFQESIDEVARWFRDHPDLRFGNVVVGLRIAVIDERMFGDVLVHYAECELPVSFHYRQL